MDDQLYRNELTRDDIRDIAGLVGVSLPTMFAILDGLREGLVPVEPDPEDVVTEYLVKRGVPRDDAWMAAHHLIHTVLYCLSADSLTGIGGDE